MPNRKVSDLPFNPFPTENDFILGVESISPNSLQRMRIADLPFSNSPPSSNPINVNIIQGNFDYIDLGLEEETKRPTQLINSTFSALQPIVYIWDFTTTYPETYSINIINFGTISFKIIIDQTQDEFICNPNEWYFILGFQGYAWWSKMR